MSASSEKIPPGHDAARDPAFPRDPLDDALAAALRARKEPLPGIDIAAMALSRAHAWQAQELNLVRLAKLTRWARIVTFAAAAMIAMIIAIAYEYWPAATNAADSLTDTTTSTANIDFTTVGIAAFVVTLVVVVLAALFTPDRPQLRLTPA